MSRCLGRNVEGLWSGIAGNCLEYGMFLRLTCCSWQLGGLHVPFFGWPYQNLSLVPPAHSTFERTVKVLEFPLIPQLLNSFSLLILYALKLYFLQVSLPPECRSVLFVSLLFGVWSSTYQCACRSSQCCGGRHEGGRVSMM